MRLRNQFMTQEDCSCFRSGMKILFVFLITGIAAVLGITVIGFVQVVRAWNDIFR